MAISSVKTMIPLDRAAVHLGIDPYHFNCIYTDNHPVEPTCDDVWFQYDYQQSGKVSRESLAFALAYAEKLVAEQLDWFPVPQWVEDEVVQLPMHIDVLRYNLYNSRGMDKSITTRWGQVITAGVRQKDPIELDAAVTFENLDGDTYDEIMQVVVATDVTDPEEIRVYYPDKDAKDIYEIRPLSSVEISGGNATIQFPRYLGVLENLINKVVDEHGDSMVVDGEEESNFLQTVDVYQVWTDTSEQMTLQTEGCTCTNGCEYCTETACTTVRNPRLGHLSYRRADYTDGAWVDACTTYPATRGLISYLSGWRDMDLDMPLRQMDRTWERLIVFYAVSQLDTRLCGCTNTENTWQFQTEDLALNTDVKSRALPWAMYLNVFGSSRAAVNLSRRIYSVK